MNILESLLSTIAPHRCLGCGRKGFVLCDDCEVSALIPSPSRCYRCHKSTNQSQTCLGCRKTTGIHHVWVATQYGELAKEVLETMKFHRASSASKDIARYLAGIVPILPCDTVVTYAPTAHSRIRKRGFDQSKLIAKELARLKGLKFISVFERVSSTRQLGANRKQRFEQANSSFKVRRVLDDTDKILIIDDVTTSGATIEALAKLAKKSGATTVDASVFAQVTD